MKDKKMKNEKGIKVDQGEGFIRKLQSQLSLRDETIVCLEEDIASVERNKYNLDKEFDKIEIIVAGLLVAFLISGVINLGLILTSTHSDFIDKHSLDETCKILMQDAEAINIANNGRYLKCSNENVELEIIPKARTEKIQNTKSYTGEQTN